MTENIRINGQRLWDSIMEMGKIGETAGGGSHRLTLSDEDKVGRELFTKWCEEAGCTVTVDRIGNMFARRPGKNNDLDPIAIGSHLDTQPFGGKFDGVFGVLSGLEVIRTLNDNSIETEHPLEIVNWTNEEGARFAPAMLASGVFAGHFDLGLLRYPVSLLTMGRPLAKNWNALAIAASYLLVIIRSQQCLNRTLSRVRF